MLYGNSSYLYSSGTPNALFTGLTAKPHKPLRCCWSLPILFAVPKPSIDEISEPLFEFNAPLISGTSIGLSGSL